MASTSSKNSRQQRAEQMRREREKAEKRRRNGITIGIVVVVVILIAVAAFAVVNEVGKSNAPAAKPKNTTDDYGIVYDQEAAGGPSGGGGSSVAGAAAGDAVPVVIYEDFTCPACRANEEQNGQFFEQQVASGAITVEYRPFDFLKERGSTTEYGMRGANAAACVADTAGPKAVHELQKLLYANQPAEGGEGLSDDQIADYARQAGALETESCIKDEKWRPWVEEATEAALDSGVQSTPTITVGGKQVPEDGGVPNAQTLQQAITAATTS